MFFQHEDYIIITHADLDGAVSAIQFHRYFGDNCVYTQYTGYGNFKKNVTSMLQKTTCRNVVVLDIALEETTHQTVSENFDKIVWIDHHESSLQYKDEVDFPLFLNTGAAACKLVKLYFEQKLGVEYDDKMKQLVYLANDYDLFTIKDRRSLILNEAFWLSNGAWNFATDFSNGYDINDLTISARMEDGKNVFDEKRKYFDKAEKTIIDNSVIIVYSNKIINEVLLFADDNIELAIIVRDDSNISIRSKYDISDLLNYCKHGNNFSIGGHKHAGGIHIVNKDFTVNDVITKIGEWYDTSRNSN